MTLAQLVWTRAGNYPIFRRDVAAHGVGLNRATVTATSRAARAAVEAAAAASSAAASPASATPVTTASAIPAKTVSRGASTYTRISG